MVYTVANRGPVAKNRRPEPSLRAFGAWRQEGVFLPSEKLPPTLALPEPSKRIATVKVRQETYVGVRCCSEPDSHQEAVGRPRTV